MTKPNSLYHKYSRYVGGGKTETANNYIEWWERTTFTRANSDIVYVVGNHNENRLDLIAAEIYGEPRWWWLIAQYNNILDPASEIVAGRVLLIPSRERMPYMITTKQGGIESMKRPVELISPVII